ncbi:MAG: hypothetical protein HQM02_14175 [Magnetococcales bacterium]|nr:hypothetical protein [Magnetococcales bacterium]
MSHLSVKVSKKSKNSKCVEQNNKKVNKKKVNKDLNMVGPACSKEAAIVGVPLSP